MNLRSWQNAALALAVMLSAPVAPAEPLASTYYIGDGDIADFALELKNEKDAILYLTRKPSNEPLAGALVSLQPASGDADVKFEAGSGPGIYVATLAGPASLPGQILIQTSAESDAIETTIPKYLASKASALESIPSEHSSPAITKPNIVAFAAGATVSAVLAAGIILFLRRRQLGATAVLLLLGALVPLTVTKNAYGHEGHDHGGPSLETDGSDRGEVVLPKKSQLLIDLRTLPAKVELVPGVMRSYGHIIPKPQLDATITAPQPGFLRGTQGLTLSSKVRRGQVLGTLQAVGEIRLESPIDGEVSEIFAVDGARVDAGGRLFRITDPSVLWVDAEMFADQLANLGRVTGVSVTFDGASQPIKAHLLNSVTPLSEETRTAKVFLELESPPVSARMGMLATISFALDNKSPSIPVPAATILNKAGDRIVFIQTGPETFAARQVVVEDGPVAGTVLITQGVKEGERLVVSGNYQLLMKAK